jgi:hypothetical protein
VALLLNAPKPIYKPKSNPQNPFVIASKRLHPFYNPLKIRSTSSGIGGKIKLNGGARWSGIYKDQLPGI